MKRFNTPPDLFVAGGLEGSTPEPFAKVVAARIPLWCGVAKAYNIKADRP